MEVSSLLPYIILVAMSITIRYQLLQYSSLSQFFLSSMMLSSPLVAKLQLLPLLDDILEV